MKVFLIYIKNYMEYFLWLLNQGKKHDSALVTFRHASPLNKYKMLAFYLLFLYLCEK